MGGFVHLFYGKAVADLAIGAIEGAQIIISIGAIAYGMFTLNPKWPKSSVEGTYIDPTYRSIQAEKVYISFTKIVWTFHMYSKASGVHTHR